MSDIALFGKTRARVLRELLVKLQPGHRLYFNQLVSRAGTGSGAVSREVDKLIKLGLITDEWEGNHRYLQATRSASVHVELHAFLSKCMSQEATEPQA